MAEDSVGIGTLIGVSLATLVVGGGVTYVATRPRVYRWKLAQIEGQQRWEAWIDPPMGANHVVRDTEGQPVSYDSTQAAELGAVGYIAAQGGIPKKA